MLPSALAALIPSPTPQFCCNSHPISNKFECALQFALTVMVVIKFYRWRSVPRGFGIQKVLPSQASPEQFDLWPTREGHSETIQASSFDILTPTKKIRVCPTKYNCNWLLMPMRTACWVNSNSNCFYKVEPYGFLSTSHVNCLIKMRSWRLI